LLALQAEVAVRVGFRQVASKALDAFGRLLKREQATPGGQGAIILTVDAPPALIASVALTPLNPCADAIEARLLALRANWARNTGEPGQAKALLEAFEARKQAPKLAMVALELAACDLEASELEDAERWGKEALTRARRERSPQLKHAALSLLAELEVRRGDLDGAVSKLQTLATNAPDGLPQLVLETRQRWLSARLMLLAREVSEEGRDLFDVADAHAKMAARVHDVGATARAVFLVVQIALRTRRPVEALASTDWLEQLAASEPVGAPARHAVEWLVASVHYQLKWFKSANALSRRAMETLRVKAQATPETEREAWFASDKSFIGYFR